MKNLKDNTLSESQIQISCVNYFNNITNIHKINAVLFKIDNEGKRSIVGGSYAKKMGLKAGIPDIGIIYNGITYYVEFKASKGRLSKNQIATHKELTQAGASVVTLDTIDKFISYLSTIFNNI